MAMRFLAFTLACLTCAGHGRRVQATIAHNEAEGALSAKHLKALALLVGALNPASGWQVTGAGHSPVQSRRMFERRADTAMHASGAEALLGRRELLLSTLAAAPILTASAAYAKAAAISTEDALQQMKDALAELDKAPEFLDAQEWDKVRTILKIKVPNFWANKAKENPVRVFLDEVDPDSIDLVDEIKEALQLCDQFTYDNIFIPFQPGKGQIKIKEPREQLDLARAGLKKVIAKR